MSMMVMNLTNLAVTEYTQACTGLAGDVECRAAGVYDVDADDATPVDALLQFGMTLLDTRGRLTRPKYVYMHGQELDTFYCTVTKSNGEDSYEYAPQSLHERVQRFVLGAGIRDTHLTLQLQALQAAKFVLEKLSFEYLVSNSRRL